MPYATVADAQKKHPNLDKYSAHGQRVWKEVFNNALKEYGDEGKAFASAYSAANKADGVASTAEKTASARVARLKYQLQKIGFTLNPLNDPEHDAAYARQGLEAAGHTKPPTANELGALRAARKAQLLQRAARKLDAEAMPTPPVGQEWYRNPMLYSTPMGALVGLSLVQLLSKKKPKAWQYLAGAGGGALAGAGAGYAMNQEKA